MIRMFTFRSVLLCLLLSNCVFSVSNAQIISNDDFYRYFAATDAAPSADWYLPGFDDSSWNEDTASVDVGYLFNELPPNTKSLYLRYHFNMDNAKSAFPLNFSADFDDGYIVYLNGREVARKNVPDSISFPEFDAVTCRSHEAEFNQRYPVYGVYLDTTVLDTCLVQGDNVFAVHVLNDTLEGSDLFFNLNLFNVSNYFNFYHDQFRFIRQMTIDSVNYPLVWIETDEFGIPHKNKRVRALMGIIDNGPGEYNKPGDSCNVFYGDIDIEVRGQSSADFPKRSYRFELKDEFEGDSNVVLLGMPSDDDWILMGPYHDKSQFRNKMMFDLARNFGRYQPRSEFCELILNGEYLGLYAITETIKQHSERVNIAKLRTSEISGIDVTGGYILKYDKPGGLQIDYPKPDNIQPEQDDYIRGYIRDYTGMIFTDKFWSADSGFRRYINDTALVDYMIMTEFCKNADGYYYSTYFTKNRADIDDRLTFGPLWDHDLVFGNTIYQEGYLTTNWQFEFPQNGQNIKIKRFLQDEGFADLFKSRWHDARNTFLSDERVFGYIDSMVIALSDPLERNYSAWPVIDKSLFSPYYVAVSYDDEIYHIKDWLTQRLAWIDDNIDDLHYDSVFYSPANTSVTQAGFGFDVYPNPFRNQLIIAFTTEKTMPVDVEIFSISGRLIYHNRILAQGDYTELNLGSDIIGQMAGGVYLLNISSEGQRIASRKLLKQ